MIKDVENKTKVGIIGTAGRREDGAKMTKEIFEQMVEKTEQIVTQQFRLNKNCVTFVSGGSAWADHIAVKCFLNSALNDGYSGLTLFLPCDFSLIAKRFSEQPKQNNTHNNESPGRTLNILHSQFSSKTGLKSMDEITCAHALGAILDSTHSGFHARNTQVAKCDFMIAFTWGESVSEPKKGGTFDTWKMSKCVNKVHVPLHTLLPLSDAQLMQRNVSRVSDFFSGHSKRDRDKDISDSQCIDSCNKRVKLVIRNDGRCLD